mmetsp:Transcript_32783/g.47832  ORF Transcript_32783/g.47832 Transcript_32783/m.47832 type:complete len:92 (-) Transcript_32783:420-695(-)
MLPFGRLYGTALPAAIGTPIGMFLGDGTGIAAEPGDVDGNVVLISLVLAPAAPNSIGCELTTPAAELDDTVRAAPNMPFLLLPSLPVAVGS